MSDIFGGIFDSFSSLFDSDDVVKALGKAGVATFGSTNANDPSMRELNYGSMDLGISSTFNSSKTGAVESVQANNFEKLWESRLKKFAQIESESGVKLK